MSGKQLQISETLRAASEKLALVIGVNPLEPVFRKAEVVIAVREWLQHPEVMDKVKQLKNTPSGFQTDEATRSGGAYDDKTVAIAVTDALAAGFQLVGNEFNIISGRMMGVLNGYARLVREWRNEAWRMGSMDVVEGDIKVNGNMVAVPITIEYQLISADGKEKVKNSFHRVIQLRQRSQHDTPDAWIGKATRRALKKLHVYLTGQDIGDDMGDEGSAGSGAAQTTAAGMPPTGKVDLSKEKPAKAAEVVQDADWSPVDAGAPEPGPAPTAAPEKPYAEMNQAERREATAKANGKTSAPAAPPPKDVF